MDGTNAIQSVLAKLNISDKVNEARP